MTSLPANFREQRARSGPEPGRNRTRPVPQAGTRSNRRGPQLQNRNRTAEQRRLRGKASQRAGRGQNRNTEVRRSGSPAAGGGDLHPARMRGGPGPDGRVWTRTGRTGPDRSGGGYCAERRGRSYYLQHGHAHSPARARPGARRAVRQRTRQTRSIEVLVGPGLITFRFLIG